MPSDNIKNLNWSEFDRGIFLVNVLGVVYDPKTRQILIGLRKADPYIQKLSWAFPGGRPAYVEDLEYYLRHEIKKKTGLEVEVKKIIFAKTYPENRKFLSIYYYCEMLGGEEKMGEKFTEIKWVKPSDVQKYFTTSIHPTLLNYLKSID